MVMDDRNRPLYMISVAAELAGVHPQTLRAYEQKGLVTPQRTSGNTRRYAQADSERLGRDANPRFARALGRARRGN